MFSGLERSDILSTQRCGEAGLRAEPPASGAAVRDQELACSAVWSAATEIEDRQLTPAVSNPALLASH